MAHDDEGRGSRSDDADGLTRDAPTAPWLPGSAARGTAASATPAWRPPTADARTPRHDTGAPAVSIGGASAATPASPSNVSAAAPRDGARAQADSAADPWHIVEAISEPITGATTAVAQTGAAPAFQEALSTPAPDAAAAQPWAQAGATVPPVAPPPSPLGAPVTDDGRRRNGRLAAAFAVLGGVAVAAIIVAMGFVAGWWGPRDSSAGAPPVAATDDAGAAVAGSEPRSDGTRPLQSPSASPSASSSPVAPTVTRASLVNAVYSAPAPAMCQHAAGTFANGVDTGSSPGGSRAGLHIANPDGSRVNQDGIDRFAATGDLTGDGVPEIAVAAWCEIGGETKPASVLVYTPTASGDLELVGMQNLGDLSGTIRAWADTLSISNGVLHVTWDGPWGTTQEKLASADFTVRGGSLVSSGYQESVRAK